MKVRKIAASVMALLLFAVFILPQSAFAQEATEEESLTNFTVGLTYRSLENPTQPPYQDVVGATITLTNNETKEVFTFTTESDPFKTVQRVPAGTYTFELKSVPEAIQGKFDMPAPKTIVVKKGTPAKFDGFNVVQTLASIFKPEVAKEEVSVGEKVDLTDNVTNLDKLPKGTKVEDVTPEGAIDINKPGEYIGKIEIIYPDNSRETVDVIVSVVEKTKPNDNYWIIPWTPTKPSEEAPKHETAIHKLYINGYEDSTFRPEGNMTRAEAAAMLARLQGLDLSNNAKSNFVDVRSGWYNAAINAVVNAGYMKGYPDGTFRPDGKITRAEFAQMIKAIDKANSGMAPFADVKGHWAEAAIEQAYANGRITGYPDGTFRPNDQITRAEAVTIFNKLYDRHVEEPGIAEVKSRLVEFNDINRGHWAYFQVVEASNTHEFYRTEKGKVDETWVRVLQTWKEALANR